MSGSFFEKNGGLIRGIDGIEENEFLATYGDKPGFARELLGSFLTDVERRLPTVSKYRTEDKDAYISALNALSVSLAEILAIGLSVRAKEIEAAVIDSDKAYILAHEENFATDLHRLCQDIREALSTKADTLSPNNLVYV